MGKSKKLLKVYENNKRRKKMKNGKTKPEKKVEK